MDDLNEKIKRVFADLGLRCAYNMPRFWANGGKDYVVIPTRYAKGYQKALEDAEREITEVLSEQPEHTETHSCDCEHTETHDLVSREAAIDVLDTGLWGVEWDKALATAMLKDLPSAQPERMTNRQWVDFLSAQFDISRTSAKEMLHGMMRWKKEDNFKKMFNGGRHESRPNQQTGNAETY